MTEVVSGGAAFGVFVPDFNAVVEPELGTLRPDGVVHQTTRFALGADVVERIAEAGERLLPTGIGSWILGLSTESFAGGLDLLAQGVEAVQARTERPVHTPPQATRRALEVLGARRIGIVTPFDESANANVRAVYEAWGFEVTAMHGLHRPALDEIANTPPDEIRAAFAALPLDAIDTLVQVGTGLPMLPLIATLEQELARPVVAANLAVYWEALRSAGVSVRVPGAGRLFDLELPEAL